MNQSTLRLGPRSRAATCALAAILSSSAPGGWAGDFPVIINVDPCPQCRVVGPGGLSEITVTFNMDVNVVPANISVRTRASMGADVGFKLSGIPESDTVTIVLDDAVETDVVTVVLDYTITSVATGEAFDGEVSDPRSPALPSGDGLPGGQAVLQFAVLQGDVDGDFAVTALDQALVISSFGKAVPCTCADTAPIDLPDVDGDLDVDGDDLILVSAALGLFIPQTDLDAPTVELTPDGTTAVCGELDTVTADFSESLATATATATTLFALDSNGELQASSSATLGGSDDMIDYTFSPPLSINVDYDFTLSESIMDPSGELINRTLFSVSTSEPIIDVDPVGQTVCELDTVIFDVQASGTGMLTYQWRLDGIDRPGATDSTLTIASADMSDEGLYDVVVTDPAGCSTTSGVATLTVEAPPTIDAQPSDQTVCAPDSVEFTVAASGAGALKYQWRKDLVNLPGETYSKLTIYPTDADDAGDYDVVITDEVMICSTVSEAATLDFDNPTITTQPEEDTTATEGDLVELTVQADGDDPFTYQWRKNAEDIEGAILDTLTFDPADTDDTGVYDVVVTDVNGCKTVSKAATLTVDAASGEGGGGGELEIQTQPMIAEPACEGDTIEFSVTASGAVTLTYQWTKDGEDIAGATSDTLTLEVVDADDEGDYAVTVSDVADNTLTSDSATLTVNDMPTITTQPTDKELIEGETATFSVTAGDVCSSCYQWRMDGTDLLAAVTATLTIPDVGTADAGDYDVVVTDGNGCSAVSDTVTLSVDIEPTPDDGVTIESHPASQTVCEGDGVTLSASATGAADLTLQWSLDGVDIAEETGSTLTIDAATAADSGDYTVEVSDGTDSLSSDAATLTVEQAPAIVTPPANQTIDSGAAVSFSVTADGAALLSYQWFVDGAIIAGATGSTLTLTSDEASSADGRVYQVTVTNNCGSATAATATLTVNAGGDVDPTAGDPVPGDGTTTDQSMGGGCSSPCGMFDLFCLIVLALGLAGLRFGRSRRGRPKWNSRGV